MLTPIMTITSTENAVSLTRTEQAITMRLSDEILDEAHREIEADKDVSAPGWVGDFARFVTGSVEKMLRSSIEYPLADIASIDYQNGTLAFTYRKKRILTFEDVQISVNGVRKQALSCFAPDDARAFFAKVCELLAR